MLSEVFLEQVRLAENRVKMPKLNLESLSQFVIPLAPLAEQQRIVKKIDQLMSMCDTLEHQIDTARETQSAMLNAMMAQYGGQRCA
jgi:type I restriction enzyme S subunit